MKLKRVEIHGFKSFGKKTLLEFPEGISAIVGPNGSGKSNVIDAICFALGYPSRNLRAAKAQELIYSGKLANVPHAQVSLTFQKNKDYFEVKRKVDRKGKSVYKLNSSTASLDGVHDMLSKHSIPKDGFNIVMQNDVMKFIEVKPAERRKILDQISGISGYEEKKKKSLEELSIVERRISDTNLILSEKKGYLEEIGRDRELAIQYKDMQEELKKSKSIYYYSTLYELENQEGLYEDRLDKIAKEKDIKITELARIDEEIDGIEQRLDAITRQIINTSGGESGKIKGEMGALKSAIERKQEEIQFLKDEIGDLESKKRESMQTRQGIRERISQREESLKSLRSEIKSAAASLAKKEQERDQKTKEYDNSELIELENQRKELSETIFEKRRSLSLIEKELDNLESRESELKEKLSEDKARSKDIEREIAQREQEIKKLGADYEKAEKLSQKIESGKEKLSDLYQKYARLESEIRTIERIEAKMGESESLKLVLNNKSKGYIGQARELGKAPDKYKVALEVAAGDKSKCLVVKDDSAAEFFIKELRKNKIGRATFLPLNKINGPPLKDIKGDGIFGFAKDLIECDKKYQKVFDFIFGETLVVKDIDTARRIGIGKIKMVTLEGDIVARGGAMTGGYYQKKAISFSSTEDKKKELEKITQEIANIKDGQKDLESELSRLERINLGVLREKKANLSEKLESISSKDNEYLEELKSFDPKKKELLKNKKTIEEEISRLGKNLAKIESKMNVDALNKMKDALADIDAGIHEIKDLRYELQTKENNIRSDIENMFARIKDLDAQADEVDRSISKYKEKIRQSIDDITESGKKLQDLEQKHSLVTKESQKFFAEQERLNQLIRELGEKKGLLEAELDRLKREQNDIEIKKAKTDARLEEIRSALENIEKPPNEDLKDADVDALGKRIKELERELGAIEGVNLRAVDMYDELEKQYAEIKERNERLHMEKEKIYDLIETIEEKKRTVFFEAFGTVKEHFERIISELYPSTMGNLLLENDNDPFNSGLILEVKPRGREGMNIDSLSGGEKTLTALAFLMATQGVSPSPFYILDEVDAALDQENVLRLVRFLKNNSSSAQFIMISHNPETVKHMDSVVGVHMQDGLSRTVGVDMQMMEAR